MNPIIPPMASALTPELRPDSSNRILVVSVGSLVKLPATLPPSKTKAIPRTIVDTGFM